MGSSHMNTLPDSVIYSRISKPEKENFSQERNDHDWPETIGRFLRDHAITLTFLRSDRVHNDIYLERLIRRKHDNTFSGEKS